MFTNILVTRIQYYLLFFYLCQKHFAGGSIPGVGVAGEGHGKLRGGGIYKKSKNKKKTRKKKKRSKNKRLRKKKRMTKKRSKNKR